MPNFKQFIKGFEEPEQPEVKTQPKAQEVETKKPKVEESEFSKSRPAFTHDFAESLRKDAINWANEKLPYDKSLPKILNNYTRDEVIDFMRGNIGEDEIMKRAKERNGINQDRVNLLAKQEAAKPQPKPQGDMIGGLTKPEREKHYQAIFDKYDKDEKFWNHPKERKFDKGTLLADVYGEEPMAEELAKKRAAYYAEDDNEWPNDDKKMADEFYEYVTARGWEDERAGREPEAKPQPKPAPKPGSFEKFMQDNEEKPQPLAPEQVKDKMDEEFFDNWKFIYNNLPKSRIAEIAAERTGIPVEQVKAYLEENLKDRPDEEWDADWERSYGPMDLGDWDNVDELKYAFKKADNGGAYGTAENALGRLEELGAVEKGTLERYLNGQKIVLD